MPTKWVAMCDDNTQGTNESQQMKIILVLHRRLAGGE